MNHGKDDIKLDKAFNTQTDKTREGQEGKCMVCVHDIKKAIYGRNENLQKRIPRNPLEEQLGITDTVHRTEIFQRWEGGVCSKECTHTHPDQWKLRKVFHGLMGAFH